MSVKNLISLLPLDPNILSKFISSPSSKKKKKKRPPSLSPDHPHRSAASYMRCFQHHWQKPVASLEVWIAFPAKVTSPSDISEVVLIYVYKFFIRRRNQEGESMSHPLLKSGRSLWLPWQLNAREEIWVTSESRMEKSMWPLPVFPGTVTLGAFPPCKKFIYPVSIT